MCVSVRVRVCGCADEYKWTSIDTLGGLGNWEGWGIGRVGELEGLGNRRVKYNSLLKFLTCMGGGGGGGGHLKVGAYLIVHACRRTCRKVIVQQNCFEELLSQILEVYFFFIA